MKKLLAITAMVSTLAFAHSASFASASHTLNAKAHILASHAKASAAHHSKVACPITPKCKCD